MSRARDGDYRMARIGAALAITSIVVVLVFLDAIVPSYTISPTVLVVLVSAILGLLGVEVGASFLAIWRNGTTYARRRRDDDE